MKKWLLLPLAILLAACSSVDHGTVTNKWHEDETYIPITTCVPAGKTNICTTQMTRVDEKWRIKVCLGQELDTDRECSNWSITEESWNQTKVGDYVDFRENN